jgi:hypothetical protein
MERLVLSPLGYGVTHGSLLRLCLCVRLVPSPLGYRVTRRSFLRLCLCVRFLGSKEIIRHVSHA